MLTLMRPRYFALAAAALLAGCGADSSVSPSTPVDLNEIFAEMHLPAMAGAASAASGYLGSTGSTFSGVPKGCNYAVASQSFVCAPITEGGLTISQSYQLLNSSGAPLSLFEPTSLYSVRAQTTVTGTETAGSTTTTLNSVQDQTLSGLQTSRHTLNGTSTTNSSSTWSTGTGTPETLALTLKTTTTDLVIPANPGPNTYPASGTITLEETRGLLGFPEPPPIVMTFNGTSKVKVTINGVAAPGCGTIDLSPASPGCS